MLKANTRWQLSTYDETVATAIAQELKIPLLLARMLVIRGITSVEQADAFLYIDERQFHDPFLLDGMNDAVNRIKLAIERAEPICLYGDYDADGVSSTSLLIDVMRELGATFDYYIPNRFTEGYGLHNKALEQISQRGFGLVITVDTGISAVEQVAFAKTLGLDVIITDHHEPPPQLPDAFAVINPKKPGCPYPFDMLAGVGVALKLAHALLGRVPLHLIDIAAIGTIADLVPLVDENRVIASLGLRALNHTRNLGLQELINVCELSEKEISAGHVGFAIGPRINAGGRLDSANEAVELLTTDDRLEAEQLAKKLDQMNRERQELVQEISAEAEDMVLSQFPPEENKVLVLAQEGWNPGVIGIVASRLVEKFYRPAIVLSIDRGTGMAKGSARSISGFDMYAALSECDHLLPHYGGHTMAAGMTLPVENIPQLRSMLNQIAQNWLTEEEFTPQTRVDVSVSLEEIDVDTVSQLESLAPFGVGNPTPLVLINDVKTTGLRKIGRDYTHLKCLLESEDKQLDAVGFQFAHIMEQITPQARVQVVGELSINEWNGHRKPQLVVRDLAVPHRQVFDWRGLADRQQKWFSVASDKESVTIFFQSKNHQQLRQSWLQQGLGERMPAMLLIDSDDQPDSITDFRSLILYDLPRTRQQLTQTLSRATGIERIYCLFDGGGDSLERIHLPTREQFIRLYQIFRQHRRVASDQLEKLAANQRLKRETLERMLDVFVELKFIQSESNLFLLHPDPVKSALENSTLYRGWIEESKFYTDLLLSSYDLLVNHLLHPVENTAVPTIS